MNREDVVIGETYLTPHGSARAVRWVHPVGVVAVSGLGWEGYVCHERLRNTATDAEIDAAFAAKQTHTCSRSGCGQGTAGAWTSCSYCRTPVEPVSYGPHPDGDNEMSMVWEATDAPNYGGWSEGDVLAYLSQFGEVEQYGTHEHDNISWGVRRSLFTVAVMYISGGWEPTVGGSMDGINRFRTLTEAMQWAVERWRELVAESDPMPDPTSYHKAFGIRRCTTHVMTGDLGTRSEFGTGWHDSWGD